MSVEYTPSQMRNRRPQPRTAKSGFSLIRRLEGGQLTPMVSKLLEVTADMSDVDVRTPDNSNRSRRPAVQILRRGDLDVSGSINGLQEFVYNKLPRLREVHENVQFSSLYEFDRRYPSNPERDETFYELRPDSDLHMILAEDRIAVIDVLKLRGVGIRDEALVRARPFSATIAHAGNIATDVQLDFLSDTIVDNLPMVTTLLGVDSPRPPKIPQQRQG